MKKVLKFWASWCGPCKTMQPEFIKVKNEMESDTLVFNEINVDEDTDGLTRKYGIRGIPCIVITNENGDEINRLVGLNNETRIKEFITQNI